MRHLRSILYALVLAPTVWVLAGVGFTHDLSSRGRELFAAESFTGLLLLLLAGVAYAILVFAPVSPAGPVLGGVAFLGGALWAWNNPQGYASVWPPEVTKDGFDLSRPGYGLAALLAVPLLCTVLSARRWARYEPPVLPIIGQIGRARGSAPVAGISVASEETTVFRAGTGIGSADETQVVRAPSEADATQVVVSPPAITRIVPPASFAAPQVSEDATIALDLRDAEPTTMLVIASQDTADVAARPATAVTEDPAEAKVDAEATTDLASAERTTILASAEPTTILASAEPTTDLTGEERTTDLTDAEHTTGLTSIEPTTDLTGAEQTSDLADADRTVAVPVPTHDDEPTRAVAGKPASLVTPPTEQDRTEAVTIPVGTPAEVVSATAGPESRPTARGEVERDSDESADATRALHIPAQRTPPAAEA